MTTDDQLPGQLSLLGGSDPAPDQRPTSPRRSRQAEQPDTGPEAEFTGTGTCRACDTHLVLYRCDGRLTAWDPAAEDLGPACPGCGLAITTTTVTIRHDHTTRKDHS